MTGPTLSAPPAPLLAGVARRDITDYDAGPVHDPLYAKALVLRRADETLAIVTLDVVALEEIGPLAGDFLPEVRRRLRDDLGLDSGRVLLAASHCHGRARADAADHVVRAVADAFRDLTPVRTGAGTGRENRIMANRRIRLDDGRETDERRAYSLPPDERVAGGGPVDPRIGIIRLDRRDNGRPLAVLYNFGCHPIMEVPDGADTADLSGFASRAIEEALGPGVTAFFLQGCAGDVNPIGYKDTAHPRDAEPLGNRLGLAVLRALPGIAVEDQAELRVFHRRLALPRADLRPAIEALEREQRELLDSLTGTSLDLKSFLELAVRYGLAPDYPSAPAHLYRHGREQGREDLDRLDERNRRLMKQYRENVLIMETLVRLRENLRLLKMHQAQNRAAGGDTIEIDLLAARIGSAALVSFPGELSARIGCNIRAASLHDPTLVATCANGYIYYAPTAEQLRNRGHAQEDSDCLLAPEWQARYEQAALELLELV